MFSPAFQNEYMKDDFMIKIETWHKPDMGTVENVSQVSFMCIAPNHNRSYRSYYTGLIIKELLKLKQQMPPSMNSRNTGFYISHNAT